MLKGLALDYYYSNMSIDILIITPRNDSIRFGFCHLETEPMSIRFFDGFDSIRFDSVRVFTGSKPSKRVRKALDLIFETWS
jgi:hypothetical protein